MLCSQRHWERHVRCQIRLHTASTEARVYTLSQYESKLASKFFNYLMTCYFWAVFNTGVDSHSSINILSLAKCKLYRIGYCPLELSCNSAHSIKCTLYILVYTNPLMANRSFNYLYKTVTQNTLICYFRENSMDKSFTRLKRDYRQYYWIYQTSSFKLLSFHSQNLINL